MARRMENHAGRMAVPQFGGWDQKSVAAGSTENPNYSVVFSAARANRKQNKTDAKRGASASAGTDQELINPFHDQPAVANHFQLPLPPPPLSEEPSSTVAKQPVVVNHFQPPPVLEESSTVAKQPVVVNHFQPPPLLEECSTVTKQPVVVNHFQPPPLLEESSTVTKQPVVVNHFQPPPLLEEGSKPGWKAVPQFGGWDQKSAAAGGSAGNPNYSMVFSAARANRKQHKTDVKRGASVGNDQELINPFHQQPMVSHFKPPPLLEECNMKKKKFFRYFSCCSV